MKAYIQLMRGRLDNLYAERRVGRAQRKRLERTRHKLVSLVSCVGEPAQAHQRSVLRDRGKENLSLKPQSAMSKSEVARISTLKVIRIHARLSLLHLQGNDYEAHRFTS
jgi:hypothetical protein